MAARQVLTYTCVVIFGVTIVLLLEVALSLYLYKVIRNDFEIIFVKELRSGLCRSEFEQLLKESRFITDYIDKEIKIAVSKAELFNNFELTRERRHTSNGQHHHHYGHVYGQNHGHNHGHGFRHHHHNPPPPGPPGGPGPPGPPGPSGIPGVKGEFGLPGDRGVPGEKGAIGPIGIKGEQGLPGKEGQKGDIGAKGEQGIPGQNGKPGLKGENGDIGLPGIQGEKGNAGHNGIPGMPGPAGPVGPHGTEGPEGKRGPKGDKGELGKTGDTGPQGKDGATGSPGQQGNPGHNGQPGLKGEKGVIGLPGRPGEKGDTGRDGVPGFDGPIGPPGKEGLEGKRGPKGDKGERGLPGLKGDKGEKYLKKYYSGKHKQFVVSNSETNTIYAVDPIMGDCEWLSIGEMELFKSINRSYNTLMIDSNPTSDKESKKFWATISDVPKLYEFDSITSLINNEPSIIYDLEIPFGGNANVVYEGFFFYNAKGNEPNIIKYDFKNHITQVLTIPGILFELKPLYLNKLTNFDFSVDQNGLWAIFSNGDSEHISVIKINSEDLTIENTWEININGRSFIDMFFAYGKLYTIQFTTTLEVEISLEINLFAGTVKEVKISGIKKTPETATYDPRTEKLLLFDGEKMVTYSFFCDDKSILPTSVHAE